MTTYLLGLSLSLLLSLGLCLELGRTIRENHVEVTCTSGRNCTLGCAAEPKDEVQYIAVRWYKLEHQTSQESGLLTRNLPNGPTRWYSGADTNVKLHGDSRDIVLPNVTCSDTGVYICYLAAPVGEQNRQGKIVLNLSDCLVQPMDLLTDTDPTEKPVDSADYKLTDTWLLISAAAMLITAFVIFLISYNCLKNTLREKRQDCEKGNLIGRSSQTPGEEGPNADLYFGSKNTPNAARLCVKLVSGLRCDKESLTRSLYACSVWEQEVL